MCDELRDDLRVRAFIELNVPAFWLKDARAITEIATTIFLRVVANALSGYSAAELERLRDAIAGRDAEELLGHLVDVMVLRARARERARAN